MFRFTRRFSRGRRHARREHRALGQRVLSSNASICAVSDCTARFMWRAMSVVVGSSGRFISAALNQDKVCIGWRRSWLADARNRVLACVADSVCCKAWRQCWLVATCCWRMADGDRFTTHPNAKHLFAQDGGGRIG